jgi:hypothetical protein
VQDEIDRPHPNAQFRHLVVDYPDVVKQDKNHARAARRNNPPTTTTSLFQLDAERELLGDPPANEELNMAKASISGTDYLQALLVECQTYAPRSEVGNATMLRMFVNHKGSYSRCFTGYSPTDPKEETRAFENIFYGPPNALIARGLFLATLIITIVWEGGREVVFPVDIYESIGLSRAPVLINLVHGMWGARLRGVEVRVNGILLSGPERFCFYSRLNHGDCIKITPIGHGLWGGSQPDAAIPPLGDNGSPAAPEALPTYQQAIEASQAQENFGDSNVVLHDIQPVPENKQQDDDDDDDDDDVYEGEEEEEEEKQPISIEKYLEQKRSDKKRKLDQLDAESKQAEKEKEERKAKYALQQVNLFNAYQTLLDVIRGYPRYLMLHHTRAMQVQYMAFTIESYLNNPREDTPIEFQNQHLYGLFQQLQLLDDYEDLEDLLKVALAFTVSPDDED